MLFTMSVARLVMLIRLTSYMLQLMVHPAALGAAVWKILHIKRRLFPGIRPVAGFMELFFFPLRLSLHYGCQISRRVHLFRWALKVYHQAQQAVLALSRYRIAPTPAAWVTQYNATCRQFARLIA